MKNISTVLIVLLISSLLSAERKVLPLLLMERFNVTVEESTEKIQKIDKEIISAVFAQSILKDDSIHKRDKDFFRKYVKKNGSAKIMLNDDSGMILLLVQKKDLEANISSAILIDIIQVNFHETNE